MDRKLTEDEKRLIQKMKKDYAESSQATFKNMDKFTEPVPNVAAWGSHYKKIKNKSDFKQKVIGAVFGAAIGDAIGHPIEFIGTFDEIYRQYGSKGVQGYTLFWEKDGKRYAPYTDDFQMAEIVLRSLIWQKQNSATFDQTMEMMTNMFVEWSVHPQGGHRSPGSACLKACNNLKNGVHWSEAGEKDAGGCGSVMRAWPFGLLFYYDKERAKRWSSEHSKATHGASIALAACAAIAVGIAIALQNNNVDTILKEMVSASMEFSQETSKMMEDAISDAKKGVSPKITLERLKGWASHESIAAACYIFYRHAGNFSTAVLEAANTPGDSDSIASIVGALCGAFNGVEKIPFNWIAGVERSEDLHDLSKILLDAVMSC